MKATKHTEMTIYAVMLHNSRMPRFCEHLCSPHATQNMAEEARVHHSKDLVMPSQMLKGARWTVQKWGVMNEPLPPSFLARNLP